MTDHSRLRRPGIAAATVALVVAGIVGGASVAGARESITIYSVENDGRTFCFSDQKKPTCAPSDLPLTVTVQTGDTVKWDMSSSSTHNAASKSVANASAAATKAWMTDRKSSYPMTSDEYVFGEPGEYRFNCIAHTGMEGTIIVTGGTVETPTATPTQVPTEVPTEEPTAVPTFSATPTASATATPDDHLFTPAPGKGARKDTEAPRLLRAKVKADRAGAKLSFWVSEPSTIQVHAYRKGVKKPVTAATLHVAAGSRSVLVRSSSLRKKGTYTFQWQATDAMANKGNIAKKTLKVKR